MSTGTYRAIEQGIKDEDARAQRTLGTTETSNQVATAAPVVVPAAPVLTVKLASDRFRIFERIAAKESRSVKSIIGECLAGCEIQLARAEAQAMRAAAIASDERERSGYYSQLDTERGPSAPGYVEIQLALVG